MLLTVYRVTRRILSMHSRIQGTLPEDLGNLGSKLILEEIK